MNWTTNRIAFAVLISMLTGGRPAPAHHGYAEYDRQATVSIEGEIETLDWVNPHVLLTLRTEATGTYRIEWQDLRRLSRTGVSPGSLEVGDRVVVEGSVNKDPEKRIMTLLRAVSRPADGWRWSSERDRGE